MLSIVLGGALGRSGRKRARRAASFLSGKGGFLTASTLITAAGVVWGIYDSVKAGAGGAGGAAGAMGAVPPVPPVPQVQGEPVATGALPGGESLPSDMLRVIRLAVSAARADGTLTSGERQMILDRAREAGLESIVDAELGTMRPLGEIVSGVSDPIARQDLYVLAFTIVRADESVSGAERIYLAQLAYQLGLDAGTVARLETETAAKIDSQD
jgi:uncharacterized membrane protein YebE (DUF533 family)